MASFNVVGIDEAIKALDIAAEEMTRRAPAAVMAGAKVAVDIMSAAAPVAAKNGGQLAESIWMNDIHVSAIDGYHCDVYPFGIRRDGERNADVGFIQEYGRSDMPARPWMRPAIERHGDEILSAITDVLTGGGSA